MSVKRSDRRQPRLSQTQPLPTEEGNLTPVGRVHVRGEDPQPNVEVPIPQQSAVRKPVVLKKIVTRLPLRELHQNGQSQPNENEHRDPIPSPTMPTLEDAMVKLKVSHFAEALLPVEIRAKIGRNLLQIDQFTVAPPQVADLSTNTPNRQNTTNIESQQETTNMVSHSSISKPDTKISDTMSRLRQRSKLHELARRRQQTSNNNNGEHTLLDRNTVNPTNVVTEPIPKVDFTPSTSVIGANLTEPAHNSPNQGACGGEPTTQLPKRKPTEEFNYSSTCPYRNKDIQSRAPNDNRRGET